MNFFHLLNKFYYGKEKQAGKTPGKSPINKTQIIVFWVILKILVDKIMLILPESYQDNGYYIAQSAWLLVLFILLFNRMKNFNHLVAMIAVIIYQLIDLITEIYIMFGGMTIENSMPLIWGTTGTCFIILSTLLFSKFHDNDH